MKRCFACLAQGLTPGRCTEKVVVTAQPETPGMWSVSQACASGVVSVVTEVVGEPHAVLQFARTLRGE